MGIFGKFLKHEKKVPGPGTESDASVYGEKMGKDTLGLGSQTGLEGDIGQQPGANLPSEGLEPQKAAPVQTLEPVQETPPEQPASFQQVNQGQTLQKPSGNVPSLEQNMQIISSKMDTIKAVLDNLSHKIEKIEQIAEGEQQPPQQQQRGW